MMTFKVTMEDIESMFQKDRWFHLCLKATCMCSYYKSNFSASRERDGSD